VAVIPEKPLQIEARRAVIVIPRVFCGSPMANIRAKRNVRLGLVLVFAFLEDLISDRAGDSS
jgi:hypothetical protein